MVHNVDRKESHWENCIGRASLEEEPNWNDTVKELHWITR